MSWLQALVLGIVQGLSEFLPISSSAHLTLTPFVLGWEEPSLAFVVAVHFGTFVAAMWLFRDIVGSMLKTALSWKSASADERKLLTHVAIATVPAVVVAIAFKAAVADAFERPVLVSLLLGVTGWWLLSTESLLEHRETDPDDAAPPARSLDEMETADAVGMGIAQAFAVLPGISRSGATIGAGMRRGLSRADATRFSFVMSIPVIFGAVLFELPDIAKESSGGTALEFLIGAVAAGVSAWLAIRWFIGLVQRRGLRPFGVYCFVLMVAGLLTALARG